MQFQILHGDCVFVMKSLPSKSVDMCVTSPPYYGLRNYCVDGQIGLEQTPEEYVSQLVKVFREVKRVLRDDGTLWLNLGDSYCGSKKSWNSNCKPKDLIGIPWLVAFALREDGWYLRQDIIWHKPNPMPESVRDRCTKAHEYIFLFSKSERYYFDYNAIKQPVAESTIGRKNVYFGGLKGREYKKNITKNDPNYRNGSEQWGRIFNYNESCKNGRNRRSVWTVATRPYKGAHFATFPTALIEPCILAGSKENGIILDPFGGSGTTAIVANNLGRNSILIELNPDYVQLANKRATVEQSKQINHQKERSAA